MHCVSILRTVHLSVVLRTSPCLSLAPLDFHLSLSEGSRADVATQRPSQLGPEDVLRVAAQTSGPKHRQGRGGPEAERPQVLQRSDMEKKLWGIIWRCCRFVIITSCVCLQSLSRCCRGVPG